MKDEDFLSRSFNTGAIAVSQDPIQLFESIGVSLSQGIQLINMVSNSGTIYIGSNADVSVDDGYPLVPSDSIYLRISDLSSIFIVSDTDDQELRYIYL